MKMAKKSISSANGDLPMLARFRPKDDYMSTFDMLQDNARNQAYSAAVRLLVIKPGDDPKSNNSDHTSEVRRWLDIGTGSGLLASLVAAAAASSSPPPTAVSTTASATTGALPAAKPTTTAAPTATSTAGVPRSPALPSMSMTTTVATSIEVYACEGVKEVANVAAKTFDNNRGGVRLFRGHSTEMEVGRDLPSRVPRVISELLGTGLLEEGILPTLRDAKARLLSPGYVSIPHSAEVWAFCCESSELRRMSRLLPSTAKSSCGAFLPPSSRNWECCPGTAAPASMHARFRALSPSVRIFDFDFSSTGHPLPGPEGRTDVVRFPIDDTIGDDSVVHAVVCWWRCFMDKDRTVEMSTSPPPPPKGPLDNKDAIPEDEVGTESSSAAPPSRDHWRQSVYMLSRPVKVGAGDAVRALACHDDSTVWFDAVEREDEPTNFDREALAAAAFHRSPALQVSDGGTEIGAGAATTTPAAPAFNGPKQIPDPAQDLKRADRGKGEEGHISTGNVAAQDSKAGRSPPACVCGLHRTCPPSRIWMLNDQERTAAFRSAIRSVILGHSGHHLVGRVEEQQESRTAPNAAAATAPAIKRRQTTAMCVACISDGFLLPLLAAQEGACEVFEIQPSAGYRAVCRDVYCANGVDVDVDRNGDDQRRVVRPFPGGVSSVYDLLLPSPAPASADENDFGSAGKKLDAVIGEPFFADLSAAAWPFESLLLFWCVRTGLEARGCFSPRTRVVPARARLLACPFACDLLFRGRRRVGTVEGVDMSAVNDGLGCHGTRKGRHGVGGDDGRSSAEDEVAGTWRPGDVESVRLSEFGHELLGESTVVLDMDLTRPLCDLLGGRKEIRCRGAQHHATTGPGAAQRKATPNKRGEGGDDVMCHGVALWLDVCLDEEGLHRLSTGPEALYWPQGLLFFDEGWLVPPCGRSFHLEVALEDGALGVNVS